MKRVVISSLEPSIEELIRQILESSNFLVQGAGSCVKPHDPAECMLDCCNGLIPPDLLVLDVIVDRACSGVEAAEKALRRWPGVKILLVSATPSDVWPPAAQQILPALPKQSYSFLFKPFTPQQLLRSVNTLFATIAPA
jgi:DNA-binding NtrC family response regulator